jgi:hypothetical protein
MTEWKKGFVQMAESGREQTRIFLTLVLRSGTLSIYSHSAVYSSNIPMHIAVCRQYQGNSP